MEKDKQTEKFGFASLKDDLLLMIKNKELLILSFAVFVSMIGFGLIMPFLPRYAKSYGATKSQIGMMMGLFSIVRIFSSPLGGRLADKVGRKPLMVGGMALYTIVMFLFGTADSVPEVFLYRGAQGFASGLIWPVTYAYVGDIVKESKRGKAMGLYSMSFASGNAVGPILGGVIAVNFNYSLAFYFTSLLALISAILLFVGIKESYERASTKSRSKKSIFDVKKFKLSEITKHPKTFLALTIGSFTVFFGLAMVYPMLPIFANEVLGMGDLKIGFIWAVMGFTQLFVMFPAGSLADRVGRKKLIVSGSLISAIFCGAISLSIGFLSLAIIVSLYTLGRSMARPSFPAFITSLTPKKFRGTGMGIYTFAQNMAWAGGSTASGFIADLIGIKFPFLFALIIGVIGAFLIFFKVKEPKKLDLE